MPGRPWNHNIHYHPLVLHATPSRCERALDVGCGRGFLARELAERCAHVVAIDADEDTLAQARGSGNAAGRIEYVLGDVIRYPFPHESFDLIAAVATLHHVPLVPALKRFSDLLRPGGVLAVVGLYRASTAADYAMGTIAVPASLMLRAIWGQTDVGARLKDPEETFQDLRNASALLPGAELRRRLLFRYSLTWRKP
jgi:2-polyprenyl-3-methyl-5-hydroxy-6-metoxy-1,4-benzoquinol methylase